MIEIDAASGRVVNRVRGISSIGRLRRRAHAAPRRATASGWWPTRTACSSASRAAAWFGGSRWAQTAGVVGRVGSAHLGERDRRGPAGTNELVRVDPDEGKVIQRIDLGFDVPQTLVPVGKDLWVITSGGEAMLVSPG